MHMSCQFQILIHPFQPQTRPQPKIEYDLEAVMLMLDIGVDVMCQCK